METTIPFMGFYNSIHDSELDIALDLLCSDPETGCHVNKEKKDFVFDKVDWKDVHEKYAKQYTRLFADKFEIELKFKCLVSPKYYNYETDRIVCSITQKELKRIMRLTNQNIFKRIIKERFTSCDGFISHYPNNLDRWPRFPDWDLNHIGTLIMAYIEGHSSFNDDWEVSILEDINETCYHLLSAYDSGPDFDFQSMILELEESHKLICTNMDGAEVTVQAIFNEHNCFDADTCILDLISLEALIERLRASTNVCLGETLFRKYGQSLGVQQKLL